ncbi:MAG: methyl-accepting chemotaxis protein [Alphaproteobacteria bacterium]|nr:methyl-accepting chemotaxis protein [Alphaproteobacteria bacterium]
MTSVVRNWPLAKKMAAAFALIAILLALIAAAGIWTNRDLSATSQRQVERGLTGSEALSEIGDELREQRIIVLSDYNAASAAEASDLEGKMAESRKRLGRSLAAYARLADEIAPELGTLRARIAALDSVNDRILVARGAGRRGEMLAAITNDGMSASRAAIDQARRIGELHHRRSVAADLNGRAAAETSLDFVIALSLISFAGLLAIWMLIRRTVAGPMAEIAAATTALANGGEAEVPHRGRDDELGRIAAAVELFRQAAMDRASADARNADAQARVTASLEQSLAALSRGDLTRDVTADFPPAYAALKTHFNGALGALRDLIGAVGESAAQISTGSSQIAQASEDLARRTECNAASLEQTSAALAQIDSRIKATAKAAERTVRRADQTIATVSGGRATADEAVQAMGRVSDSARGIDDVIEGVDKIAFQTRVLAMNAAVEAGRAGDAGRGFAVVADLVSALAMRAEEEAKRARGQLSVTQADISAAVEAVQRVDGALQNITGEVGEVHSLLGGIAADNQAQASAITQISAAIGSMDRSTQQNAAMVEQTSAAARHLSSEVETLAVQAAQFRTGHEETAAARIRNAGEAAGPKHFAPARPRSHDSIYVSPIAALPSAGKTGLGDNGAGDGFDDWKDF